jgi:hypothetical protein
LSLCKVKRISASISNPPPMCISTGTRKLARGSGAGASAVVCVECACPSPSPPSLSASDLRHDYPEEADPAEILCALFPALLPNISDAQRVVRFIFESAP